MTMQIYLEPWKRSANSDVQSLGSGEQFEKSQAHQSVLEHKSTERVCVKTKMCTIRKPAERVCVGDQSIGFQVGEWLYLEPVKAIPFSTATTSRTPAQDDHVGVVPLL